MQQKSPICALIDAWPTRKHLADEIGANAAAVHKWAAAGRIPSDWQAPVVRAAQRLGFERITGDWMVEKHSRESGMAAILNDDVLPDSSPVLEDNAPSESEIVASQEIQTGGAI